MKLCPVCDQPVPALPAHLAEEHPGVVITDVKPFAPHPGEPHDFDNTCRLCGQRGQLHVAFITPDERVSIVGPEPALRGKDGAG